jgi:hypothetical protein
MLRRQIRIYREFPIANELTCVLISGLFACKNTNFAARAEKIHKTPGRLRLGSSEEQKKTV